MTTPRAKLGAPPALDELLRGQPLPGLERTDAEWEASFEQTMRRVMSGGELPSSVQGTGERVASAKREGLGALGDLDDVLRTPLPVEAGEPEPSDPYAFEAAERAEYDALRAPLKSGEHAPFRPLAGEAAGALPTTDATAASATDATANAATANATDATATVLPMRRRLIGIATGAGTLAAAAAVAVWLRGSAIAPEVSFPRAAAPSVALSQPAERNAASPTQAEAASPAADISPREAVAESAGNRVAAHGTKLSARVKSAAAPARAPEAMTPKAEPALVPAAGPSNLVDHPSTGAISAALSRRIPEAQRCLPPDVPSTGVRLTFQSNGSIARVDVVNSALDANARACLKRTLGAVRVDPFARTEFDVNATISQPRPQSAGQ